MKTNTTLTRKENRRFSFLRKSLFRLETVLILLAVLGLSGGIFMVIKDREKPPVAQPIVEPAVAPFKNYISGSGIIEADGSNVNVGAFVSGIVDSIPVEAGDFVEQGKVLFTVDARQALAAIEIKEAAVEAAKANLAQARTSLQSYKHLYDLIKNVSKQAVSKEEIIRRRDNVRVAEAALKVASSHVNTAQAELAAARTDLELLTVRAPMDGEVLQVNINKGEFVTATTQTSDTQTPAPILFGSVNRYQIRVQVDETDAWKFKPGSKAIAYLRGNTSRKIPLQYHHYEPYVVPKSELTGSPQERVDVRVLQVIYTYNPKDFSSYIGQQLDVYIEVPE